MPRDVSCSGSSQCIHPGNVCDGDKDCKLGDDEQLCELHDITCPSNCTCLMFGLHCLKVVFSVHHLQLPHLFISVSDSKIESLEGIINSFKEPLFAELVNNSILDICSVYFPNTLVLLDFSVNKLSSFMKNCFSSLHRLRELKLNKNRITNIERGSFTNLTQLTFLNLSHNPLTHVSEKTLSNLLCLKLISIRYVRFSTFERNTFKGIRLDVLDATDFRLCCIISAVRCGAEFPWYRSCDNNLLPDYKIKFSFSLMAVLILIVNLASV